MCHHRYEDCFHAVMLCPHAKALRMALHDIWAIPPEERLCNTGPQWFLALLESCATEEIANLAMLLWRAWTVHNKVTRAGETVDRSVGQVSKANWRGATCSAGIDGGQSQRQKQQDSG
jgi:hypothetical protein